MEEEAQEARAEMKDVRKRESGQSRHDVGEHRDYPMHLHSAVSASLLNAKEVHWQEGQAGGVQMEPWRAIRRFFPFLGGGGVSVDKAPRRAAVVRRQRTPRGATF